MASGTRGPRLPAPVDELVRHLEHQHADATATVWAQVLRDASVRVAGLGVRVPDDILAAELGRARDRALAGRRLRLARVALTSGSYTVAVGPAGRETWQLALADGTTLPVAAPADEDDAAAVIGRCALRRASCPSCHRPLTHLPDGDVGVAHTARCPAAHR